MNLPKYDSYKDSGVEWLGAIPEHWSLIFLKRLFSVSSGDFLSDKNKTDNGYPVYGGNGFRGFAKSFNNSGVMLLIGRVGAKCGNVHLVNGQYWVSEHALRVFPKVKIELPFFKYLLEAINLNQYAIRTAQPLINSEIVLNQKIGYPTIAEQKRIAEFLDRKCGEIDEAIRKKQRLIELLEEQKTILINQAVTKGLNPNAPMKDSGIEWLGEIPEHWEIKKIKNVFQIIDCKHLTAPFVENGFPLASIQEVKLKRINLSQANKTNSVFYKKLIQNNRKPSIGDIIYSRNVVVGDASLVDKDLDFALGQDVCLLRSTEFNAFFVEQLRSYFVKKQLEQILVGSTFNRINISQIKEIQIIVPPIIDQKSICNSIEFQESNINSMISIIIQQQLKLTELKQILIAEAVTGKIKV